MQPENIAKPATGRGQPPIRHLTIVWPALVALLLVVLGLTVISVLLSTATVLSVLVVAVAVILLLLLGLLVRSERHEDARRLSFTVLAVITAVLAGFVGFLLYRLPDHSFGAGFFFAGGAGIWGTNAAVFALWYWEIDAGGPRARHERGYRTVDFVFPQFSADDPQLGKDWRPNLLDYLFLAFTTNTAFSPTDTMVLSRRAKLLMMAQSAIALVVFGVLVARAVGSV